jgi:F1F0 ATPase subunit 2
MTTSNGTWLVLTLLMGAGLGSFFFFGLYWTIQKGLRSRVPALWFALSLLVRVSVVIFGFYLVVGDGSWQGLAACALGFVVARIGAGRILGAEGAPHAP